MFFMNQSNNKWWSSLQIINQPYPHVPESEIQRVMPKNLKPSWEEYMRGKTVMMTDNGTEGIYPCDLMGFVYRLEDN